MFKSLMNLSDIFSGSDTFFCCVGSVSTLNLKVST